MGWGGNKPNKATRDLVKERDARKARMLLRRGKGSEDCDR